jgi:hypothetical protein
MELTQNHIEKSGTDAVRALRIRKLGKGLPFMINDSELPSNQCYLEYPDGKIILVKLVQHARDFTPLRVLTDCEIHQIRVKYDLPVFHA